VRTTVFVVFQCLFALCLAEHYRISFLLHDKKLFQECKSVSRQVDVDVAGIRVTSELKQIIPRYSTWFTHVS
jgi:hypothetical protein